MRGGEENEQRMDGKEVVDPIQKRIEQLQASIVGNTTLNSPTKPSSVPLLATPPNDISRRLLCSKLPLRRGATSFARWQEGFVMLCEVGVPLGSTRETARDSPNGGSQQSVEQRWLG